MSFLKFIFVFISILAINVHAESLNYSFGQKEFIDSETLALQLSSADIILFGEIHDQKLHHEKQAEMLKRILNLHPIAVGMEFISREHQTELDLYLKGELSEVDFLARISWGRIPFDFYKPLIWMGQRSLGAFGVNAPKTLTSKVAKLGLGSLNETERLSLPPNFQLGQPLYFERFKAIMTEGGHQIPEEALNRYFEAQSIWDDTMAFHMLKNMNSSGSHVLIVGSFHVEYGLGLLHRFQQRLAKPKKILTIVQENFSSEEELQKALQIHPKYGQISDFLILHRNSPINAL